MQFEKKWNNFLYNSTLSEKDCIYVCRTFIGEADKQ